MSSFDRATYATPLVLLSLLVLNFTFCARADDLTGLPVDDPKDLAPAPPPQLTVSQTGTGFLPMPAWAKGLILPPLPEQLKPMGKKSLAASASAPTPAVVQPVEKASTAATTVNPDGTTAPSKPESTPAMITVSPFLQWIKANPQAAAAAARQQAAAYHAGPGAGGAGAPPITGPGAPAPSSDDNYWLPPLIDSPDFGTGATGGSAAIYTKPQR
jgi:hypothetical protein